MFHRGTDCRKALVQKRHARELASACGPLPAAFVAWTEELARSGRGRDLWRYVDYPR